MCYTGGINDKETGQLYLNARYYEPEDGRFITLDTYRGEFEESDTWHLYTYCVNNPINFIDPSGHRVAGYFMRLSRYAGGHKYRYHIILGWASTERVTRIKGTGIVKKVEPSKKTYYKKDFNKKSGSQYVGTITLPGYVQIPKSVKKARVRTKNFRVLYINSGWIAPPNISRVFKVNW